MNSHIILRWLSILSIPQIVFGVGYENSSAPVPTSSASFNSPSGYSTKVYNVSAATTTISYDYSDEELALLWDQIGPIKVGPITTTVQPIPEPTSYPRPGVFHPQVCVILGLVSMGKVE